jgi:Cysteine-rich secretory protein family
MILAAAFGGQLGLISDASGQVTPEQQAMLNEVNGYRFMHCALVNMVWVPGVADAAQQWANTSPWDATTRRFAHEQQTAYGENLAWGTNLTASAAIKLWWDEINQYNFAQPPRTWQEAAPTGHFSQLVWKNHVILGMAMSSRENMNLWVARFWPPGNIDGQYADNVRMPLGFDRRGEFCPARPFPGSPPLPDATMPSGPGAPPPLATDGIRDLLNR